MSASEQPIVLRVNISGADLIAEERKRQIEKEQWTFEHDDIVNDDFQLAQAAECYLDRYLWGRSEDLPHYWPWDRRWWKPDPNPNRLRDLVKAGALIAAEIDRIQR
jgi:hypothetical protein